MMHSRVAALLLLLGLAAVQGSRLRMARNQTQVLAAHPLINHTKAFYGNSACPCVGIDGVLWGETIIKFKDGKTAPYPADVGARCEAWDDDHHTVACVEGGDPGHGKGWCAEPWCYVDPCTCHIEVAPKETFHLPDAKFQGKPLYYSYATCGGVDTYATAEDQKAHQKAAEVCTTPGAIDAKKWGSPFCRCIGVSPQPGTTDVYIDGHAISYAADAGAMCDQWDEKRHPKCDGNEKEPEWCRKKWCFVDPCMCDLDVLPKATVYLPGAKFQGTPIFYSYATCGSSDTGERHGSTEVPSICIERFPERNTSWHPKVDHGFNPESYKKEWGKEYRNATL